MPQANKKHNLHTPADDAPVWPFPEIVRLTPIVRLNQWTKKHAGKRYYFGTLDDPAAALQCWRLDWPAITAGEPRPTRSTAGRPGTPGCQLRRVIAAHLESVARRVRRGELAPRTAREYDEIAAVVDDELGSRPVGALGPVDFEKLLDGRWGDLAPDSRRKRVTLTKAIIRGGCDLLEVEPPNFGKGFKSPPQKLIRRQRRESVAGKHFERWEIRRMLARCDAQSREPGPADWATSKACILLAINGALGQSEIATLRADRCDLGGGWIDQDRTKTDAERRVPLWPETVAAIKAARASRRGTPAARSPLLLTTKAGGPLVHGKTDGIDLRFTRIRDGALARPRGSFYWFRHTWITVSTTAAVPAAEHARKIICGHVLTDVHDRYVSEFPADMLRAVSDHVRAWLWPNLARQGAADS